jgi:hypothetical protein
MSTKIYSRKRGYSWKKWFSMMSTGIDSTSKGAKGTGVVGEPGLTQRSKDAKENRGGFERRVCEAVLVERFGTWD